LSGHPNRIRIIGGVWRSRQISVLSQEGLRPSSDRVRETLFNWLGQDLSGLKVLDAFAGSGALGFESASRDAKEVVECPITQDLLELELLMPNWACSRQMQTTQTKAALFRRTSG